ncbi:RDD family protein [Cytophaga hutchinsonii]|uniref:RDD domain-containing protein n=1 Tax=Cytophaga hutchinsonii (strain ATCC 33406 / DSM 1761 / CIP 103989 / NBRC 15051 / NCIMB 9469 / D465) TaxID=269798 RepID=A0A6N4SR92_CYTH3|nr:RDD family protein [Cytophaga hutchinsonii]ABG58864.1 hypothetical protein CHU_1594 [Cytophaga hutchinsonii ATCC 33406]SFX80894.1 Uncharacterized membrane protein YckC, RDD family [Cytophaga hutchinsonii ATCC 33406]
MLLDEMKSKSLDEIYIEKTYSHLERGVDGVIREVARTYKQKLNVKTIKPGLRFVHFIVDGIALQLILSVPKIFFFSNPQLLALISLLLIILYPVMYIFFEYKFQQTPGKMVTNYVVINEYAEKPSLRICILRTVIRFIPFEAFSCLSSPSRGWHDRWTKTYVVEKKEVEKLKSILMKYNN